MSYEGPQLEDGYAYLEITEISVIDAQGNQLVSKNGHPMMKIKWRAVDIFGNSGNIYDYVPANIDWKMRNLQNALNTKRLYDQENKMFNTALLENGHCAGVIKKDVNNPKYFKIDTYVPLEFLERVLSKLEFLRTVQEHKKKEEIKSKPVVPSVPVANMIIDELDDDIPF